VTWLRPFIREARIAYYRWALAEIDPMHPDVPYIVHRLRVLLDERQKCGPGPIETAWRWL
jgi:hypothetical protein